MKKILFISHDASRTGAPILMLNLLKWIKKNTTLNFDILLLNGGELEHDFELLGKVFKCYTKKPNSLISKLYHKIIERIKPDSEEKILNSVLSKLKNRHYSTIYGNTIVTISGFEKLFSIYPKAHYILHVHELYSITREYAKFIENTKFIDIKFIAVSELVKHNLIVNHNINSDISLIYEYINIEEIKKHVFVQSNKILDKFIINGSGLVQIRKGYDIFILIAKRAVQKYPEIPFLFRWIGNVPEYLKTYIDMDIMNGALNKHIEFTGQLIEPYSEYLKADIFILTSREDPFPLVCLEHAVMGIPVLCFDKGTGMSEFVENDAGVILPYLDIERTVDTIANLYTNRTRRQELGITAKMKVQKYDINIQSPKIIELIENA